MLRQTVHRAALTRSNHTGSDFEVQLKTFGRERCNLLSSEVKLQWRALGGVLQQARRTVESSCRKRLWPEGCSQLVWIQVAVKELWVESCA